MTSQTLHLAADMPAPTPEEDGLDAPFWQGTQQGKLLVQRCKACATWQWGPEWLCYSCRLFDLDWQEVAPVGRLYSWERVWHPPYAVLQDYVPYVIVLVELIHAGGVRMVGNLLHDPNQDVRIGAEVVAVFEPHESGSSPYTLVQWRYA